MPTIHPLSDVIIAHIAAGEVIERPAYAVKELVENALDAHATRITISLEQSGLKKIVVTDNGNGMSLDDLLECFKLHTTNKIASLEDLNEIASFGFRGEALASIASVSHLVMESRIQSNEEGYRIKIRQGKIQSSEPIGMPMGTVVTVHNIFADVPARKKFLKSPQTELRIIVDIISQIALVHPEIHFTLINNKKVIFDFPSTEQLERIKKIFDRTILENLIPIEYQDVYIKIFGWIGKPQIASSTHSKQFLFVNNRSVLDVQIARIIKRVYGNLLEATDHPIFLLFIDVPFALVDVNVHPRKEQIRFINPELIYNPLEITISQILKNYDLVYQGFNLRSHQESTKTYAANYLKDNRETNPLAGKTNLGDDYKIKQIHHLYLIVESSKGMMIVDQHAAHERILYQKFLSEFLNKNINSSELPKPYLLELNSSDSLLLEENIKTFQKMGFGISSFGENTFQISTMPELIKDQNPLPIIQEMIDDIKNEGVPKLVDQFNQKMLEFLACRSAIKAGDPLKEEQALELIRQLDKTENNETCPHGRPTRIEISLKELHKNFKRI